MPVVASSLVGACVPRRLGSRRTRAHKLSNDLVEVRILLLQERVFGRDDAEGVRGLEPVLLLPLLVLLQDLMGRAALDAILFDTSNS